MYPMKGKCGKLKTAWNVPVRFHSPQESLLLGEQFQVVLFIKTTSQKLSEPVPASKTGENGVLDPVRLPSLLFIVEPWTLSSRDTRETWVSRWGSLPPSLVQSPQDSRHSWGTWEVLRSTWVQTPWLLTASSRVRQEGDRGCPLGPSSYSQLRKSAPQWLSSSFFCSHHNWVC